MLWADTANGVLKRRNAANSGWITVAPLASTMIQAKTSTYSVLLGDYDTLIDCTSGTFSLNLTAAATLGDGFKFRARNSGTGVITIDPNSTEQIDGATTYTLGPGESIEVHCNGSAFKTIGNYKAKPTFSVNKGGSTQNIAASTETLVTFSTEEFDVGGFYDGTSKFTPTLPGKYRVTASVGFGGTNAQTGVQHYVGFYKNGTGVKYGPAVYPGTNAGVGVWASAILDLSGTDFVQVYAFAAGAGTRSIAGGTDSTYFFGELI